MNRDESRRRCEQLVGRLELPDPFELPTFCASISEQRNRPLVLLPTPMSLGTLCGLWMGTAKGDYVFYEQHTSPLHQLVIIFHEVGHILRRHQPQRVLSHDLAEALSPDASLDEMPRVLGRDVYSNEDEYEAELIATLILDRIEARANHRPVQATMPEAADIVERIAHTLDWGDQR
jgi:hypothetical protein